MQRGEADFLGQSAEAASGRIVSRQIAFATPWFQVIAKRAENETAPYYALRMTDYVSVVAFTPDRELVLVRQYRHAVERFTLELPSGHVESGEEPVEAAVRELREECGLEAREVEHLGAVMSDAGRHENRMWCYLAQDAEPAAADWKPEPGVERILVPRSQVPELIREPQIDHALNLGALMLVVAKHGPELLGLAG